MVDIRPFKGLRYNLEKAVLKNVIAPPYDVIGEKAREKLELKSPYNIVRLTLPQGERKYEKARELLNKWKSEDVLVYDKKPCLYLYEQQYVYNNKNYTRTGFVGAVKLEKLGEKNILPHEKTISKHVEDRFNLIKEVKCNLSQVFALYMDSEDKLSGIFSYIKKNLPSVSAVDDDGVKNSLWIVSDEKYIEIICQFMKDKKIYIADGHHRYTTALSYRDYRRSIDDVNPSEEKDYDYIMMMLVNFYDNGLKIFPTHRLVELDEGFDKANFFKCIEQYFHIIENVNNISEFLKDESDLRFVMVFDKKNYGLILKEDSFEFLHSVYRKVNTYVLYELIFKACFNFTDEDIMKGNKISYIHSKDELCIKIKESNNIMAFILPPVSLEIIREIADNGLTMPQKTTFFYPKLASGLVMYEFS
ncbi:MAG: DUF1015 domain-containing protein [Deferribacterota bacterium]|nr:DUF1015 domain-containing protein [Deferribacterota bacterium]